MSLKRNAIAALSGIALVGLFAGCSMAPPSASTTSSSGSDDSQLKVGLASREILNDYNRDIISGAEKTFKDAGATVTVTNAGGDPTKQVNDINSLLNSGVNVLFIELGDPAQLKPVVKKATDKGVVVVTAGVGSLVPGAIADIGGDEKAMARMSAKYLFDSLNGEGDVYAFWVPGAPLLETRLAELEKLAKSDYPGIRIHKEPSDFSPAKVQSQMQTVLTAHPEAGSIAGVWGAFDQMTSGAVQAIESAGRGDEIKVVSIDGDRDTFKMLFDKKSPFVGTVVQNAQRIGELGAQAALDKAKGKEIGQTVTSFWLATRDNGVAAAEERYGKTIWKDTGLKPSKIAEEWPQTGKVDVQNK